MSWSTVSLQKMRIKKRRNCSVAHCHSSWRQPLDGVLWIVSKARHAQRTTKRESLDNVPSSVSMTILLLSF